MNNTTTNLGRDPWAVEDNSWKGPLYQSPNPIKSRAEFRKILRDAKNHGLVTDWISKLPEVFYFLYDRAVYRKSAA